MAAGTYEFKAALRGDTAALEKLVRVNADAVAAKRDESGWTVMHYVVESNSETALDVLVRRCRALVAVGDNSGYTPIVWAAFFNYPTMIRALLATETVPTAQVRMALSIAQHTKNQLTERIIAEHLFREFGHPAEPGITSPDRKHSDDGVVLHTVREGESLSYLSMRYRVSLANLMALNPGARDMQAADGTLPVGLVVKLHHRDPAAAYQVRTVDHSLCATDDGVGFTPVHAARRKNDTEDDENVDDGESDDGDTGATGSKSAALADEQLHQRRLEEVQMLYERDQREIEELQRRETERQREREREIKEAMREANLLREREAQNQMVVDLLLEMQGGNRDTAVVKSKQLQLAVENERRHQLRLKEIKTRRQVDSADMQHAVAMKIDELEERRRQVEAANDEAARDAEAQYKAAAVQLEADLEHARHVGDTEKIRQVEDQLRRHEELRVEAKQRHEEYARQHQANLDAQLIQLEKQRTEAAASSAEQREVIIHRFEKAERNARDLSGLAEDRYRSARKLANIEIEDAKSKGATKRIGELYTQLEAYDREAEYRRKTEKEEHDVRVETLLRELDMLDDFLGVPQHVRDADRERLLEQLQKYDWESAEPLTLSVVRPLDQMDDDLAAAQSRQSEMLQSRRTVSGEGGQPHRGSPGQHGGNDVQAELARRHQNEQARLAEAEGRLQNKLRDVDNEYEQQLAERRDVLGREATGADPRASSARRDELAAMSLQRSAALTDDMNREAAKKLDRTRHGGNYDTQLDRLYSLERSREEESRQAWRRQTEAIESARQQGNHDEVGRLEAEAAQMEELEKAALRDHEQAVHKLRVAQDAAHQSIAASSRAPKDPQRRVGRGGDLGSVSQPPDHRSPAANSQHGSVRREASSKPSLSQERQTLDKKIADAEAKRREAAGKRTPAKKSAPKPKRAVAVQRAKHAAPATPGSESNDTEYSADTDTVASSGDLVLGEGDAAPLDDDVVTRTSKVFPATFPVDNTYPNDTPSGLFSILVGVDTGDFNASRHIGALASLMRAIGFTCDVFCTTADSTQQQPARHAVLTRIEEVLRSTQTECLVVHIVSRCHLGTRGMVIDLQDSPVYLAEIDDTLYSAGPEVTTFLSCDLLAPERIRAGITERKQGYLTPVCAGITTDPSAAGMVSSVVQHCCASAIEQKTSFTVRAVIKAVSEEVGKADVFLTTTPADCSDLVIIPACRLYNARTCKGVIGAWCPVISSEFAENMYPLCDELRYHQLAGKNSIAVVEPQTCQWRLDMSCSGTRGLEKLEPEDATKAFEALVDETLQLPSSVARQLTLHAVEVMSPGCFRLRVEGPQSAFSEFFSSLLPKYEAAREAGKHIHAESLMLVAMSVDVAVVVTSTVAGILKVQRSIQSKEVLTSPASQAISVYCCTMT